MEYISVYARIPLFNKMSVSIVSTFYEVLTVYTRKKNFKAVFILKR